MEMIKSFAIANAAFQVASLDLVRPGFSKQLSAKPFPKTFYPITFMERAALLHIFLLDEQPLNLCLVRCRRIIPTTPSSDLYNIN